MTESHHDQCHWTSFVAATAATATQRRRSAIEQRHRSIQHAIETKKKRKSITSLVVKEGMDSLLGSEWRTIRQCCAPTAESTFSNLPQRDTDEDFSYWIIGFPYQTQMPSVGSQIAAIAQVASAAVRPHCCAPRQHAATTISTTLTQMNVLSVVLHRRPRRSARLTWSRCVAAPGGTVRQKATVVPQSHSTKRPL